MIVNTEEYTSKTCGVCGTINNVGSKEVFTCSKCNLVIDRDINGTRNIYIKSCVKWDFSYTRVKGILSVELKCSTLLND